MRPDIGYQFFCANFMPTERLVVKNGKGELSDRKNGAFLCHFNARLQKKREDLGSADFRYDALRRYMDVDITIGAIQKDAPAGVQMNSHTLPQACLPGIIQGSTEFISFSSENMENLCQNQSYFRLRAKSIKRS